VSSAALGNWKTCTRKELALYLLFQQRFPRRFFKTTRRTTAWWSPLSGNAGFRYPI